MTLCNVAVLCTLFLSQMHIGLCRLEDKRSIPGTSEALTFLRSSGWPKMTWGSLQEPGNVTRASLAPAVETLMWEPPTIIAVSIFCCVCLLHLSAFIYAICFRIQRQPSPASTQKSSEENEVVTFHASSLSGGAHSQVGSKGSENSLKSVPCWSSF